jgi:NAD(P)-dependent dehydrogenase (short-subunit alcohol dehydrogenase family)
MNTRVRAAYRSLAGRTVLVTGGASGIGAALVRAFAGEGAKVGFVDIAKDAGRSLAEEVDGAGKEALFVPADITDTAALKSAMAEIAARLGPIGVLVNNAANDTRHDWREVTPGVFDSNIAVNLKHQFFAIQAVAPGMIAAGGGSIVNFGSISWLVGAPDLSVYETAKAAIHGLTRSFARDLGKHRIRVNVVLPGWVMTERQLKLWVNEDTDRLLAERQCLPDRIKPEDVAPMVLFLAADDSAMITSQSFVVDAGWS